MRLRLARALWARAAVHAQSCAGLRLHRHRRIFVFEGGYEATRAQLVGHHPRSAHVLSRLHARACAGPGGTIRLRRGGSGPPLLLLHGNPQTHAMWHAVAPELARRFTVVCPDLRGYGGSFKPEATADHAPYAKRPWRTTWSR